MQLNTLQDTSLYFHLHSLYLHTSRLYGSALRPLGLVPEQFMLLVALQTIHIAANLAKTLSVNRTTLSRTLKTLAARQQIQIKKVRTAKNRLQKLYELTPKGQDILKKATLEWRKVELYLKNNLEQMLPDFVTTSGWMTERIKELKMMTHS